MGEEITPNLNKLIKRSAYFNNYFYQIAAGGTSDAEFMSNNSIYPASSGAAYFLYSNNDYLSLPKALVNNGYETAALHGYRETFWNRNIMYKTLGFQNFFGEKSYDVNEKIGLGLSDKEFLSQSLDKLHNLSNPYYAFLITLSSHYPYDDTSNYGEFNVGEYENSLLGNYLKAIHYTDAQLGMFIDKLEEDGTLDNSVLAIYGDHYAIPKDKQDELAKFMNIDNMTELQWAKLQKVPLIVHFPKDANKGLQEIYGGEMDLYPTLSNLFDLPNENQLGKDLFNTKDGTVIFRNGSFTDGNIFYLSQSNSFYSIDSDKNLPESEELTAELKTSMTELDYSDEILKHNLLHKYDNSN
jgi:lipoteichoic acid synthase